MSVNITEDNNSLPLFYDKLNTKGADTLKEAGSKIFRNIDPINSIIFVAVLLFFIFIFSNIGIQKQQPEVYQATSGGNFIMLVFISLLIFLLLTNTLQYLFDFDVKGVIRKVFTPQTEIEIELKKRKRLQEEEDEKRKREEERMAKKKQTPMTFPKEVFHIPGNNYTYCDAKSVCKAFGARLATFNEVEEAYDNGAQWCSYGWSKDQLALFPTQKSTYNMLKKKKGHEHDCGRPGINGGFIKNQNVRFGVNCYGHKPQITPKEEEMMASLSSPPVTKEEKQLNAKAKYYKSKIQDILIAPFNKNKWSKV